MTKRSENRRVNDELSDLDLLKKAHKHAVEASGCLKVKVGTVIVPRFRPIEQLILGANRSIPSCIENGCNRINLYGEDSKNHRLPSDCNAVHSEIDAIANAAELGVSTWQSTVYITRYPCEACARALCAAGVSAVIYGREQEISQETAMIFALEGVRVMHNEEFTAEDTTR